MGTTLPALAPPLTSRQAWTRLALLATALAMALGTLVLSIAWLWPQTTSRIIEVPLDTLEIGVPQFIRPFDMGGARGRPYGIWLVRDEAGGVSAFSSALPHPGTCGLEVRTIEVRTIEVRTIEVREPVAVGPEPTATPLPVPRDRQGRPIVNEPRFTVGFRDACEAATFFLDGRANWSRRVPLTSLDYFRTEIRGAFVRIDAETVHLGGCVYPHPLDCQRTEMPVYERNLSR